MRGINAMKVIAKMMARGSGSTLNRKNAYPILGKPMLWHFLSEIKKTKFIDEVFVWTEDEELANVTRECGCHVIPRTREQVYSHGGFSDPDQWSQLMNDYIRKKCGSDGDIRVTLNCNYCLMTAEILENMFDRLMEDSVADSIVAVERVNPHIFMENPKTGYLFPVWKQVGLERQDYPDLYRDSAINIIHVERELRNTKLMRLFHVVDPEYLLDVDDSSDVKLAEYYLMRRMNGRIVLPEGSSSK